jgi:outer membrane receptor protein involved in Fe transport
MYQPFDLSGRSAVVTGGNGGIGLGFARALLAAGAQNLFDVFPDANVAANSNLGIFPYPSSSPFGMNGRFIYSRVSFRF